MVENNFKNAIANVGLSTRDTIIPDGKLHRFNIQGDKLGSKNGWYVLFGDDVPAGCFGC